jgi:hypothetical protein
MLRWFACRKEAPVLGEPPLSKLARDLLARERGCQEDEAIKSRALARARAVVERERTAGIGLRLFGSLDRGARPRRAWRTLLLVAAAIGAAGLAAAGVGFYGQPDEEEPRSVPSKVTAPQAAHLAVGGALVPVERATDVPPAPAPVPQARTAPPGSAAPDSARSLSLKQYATELSLLEPARSSISRGDYAAALSALSQHRREFPNGQLSQEREALRVRALWGLGQKPAALAAASAFRKRYPRSALLSWLKAEGEPSP